MRKDRDWVDYANLASNVAQNIQLSGLKDSVKEGLSDLQEAAEAQAKEMQWTRLALLQANRQAEEKAERLANLRELVLQGEEKLADLRGRLPENPFLVMAQALDCQDQLETDGVSTKSFPTLGEKDRASRLFKGLETVVLAAAKELTPEQHVQVLQCRQYQIEEPLLLMLIAKHKQREEEAPEQKKRARELLLEILKLRTQIEALKPKVKDAEAAAESAARSFWFKATNVFSKAFLVLTVGSTVALAVAVIPMANAADGNRFGDMNKWLTVIFYAIAAGIVFFMLAQGLPGLWKERLAVPGRAELKALQAKLAACFASSAIGSSPLTDLEKSMYQVFGGGPDSSSAEYEKIFKERRHLICAVRTDRYGRM